MNSYKKNKSAKYFAKNLINKLLFIFIFFLCGFSFIVSFIDFLPSMHAYVFRITQKYRPHLYNLHRWMTPLGGNNFVMTNMQGYRITQNSFSSSYLIIVFGYMDHDTIKILKKISSIVLNVQQNIKKVCLVPVFVSISAISDQYRKYQKYKLKFPHFIFLYGKRADISSMLFSYRLGHLDWIKNSPHGIYLMGPHSQLIKIFSSHTPTDRIVSQIIFDINSGHTLYRYRNYRIKGLLCS